MAAFTLGPLTGAGYGWRAMYALGLIALPLVFLLRLGIRETTHFAALDRALPAARIAWAPLAIWREPHRRPLVLCILLFGLIGALVSTFPSFYAYFLVNERAFAPAQVSTTFGLALLMGIPAIPLSGWLLDRWGRRVVGVIGPLLGATGILIAFNVGGSTTAITLAGMIGVFIGTSILPVQLVYIPELFPTSIRAIAAGWISNGAGRALVITAPAATGALAAGLGSVGLAASAMALCGVAAAVLVYAAMPETRGPPARMIAVRSATRAWPRRRRVRQGAAPCAESGPYGQCGRPQFCAGLVSRLHHALEVEAARLLARREVTEALEPLRHVGPRRRDDERTVDDASARNPCPRGRHARTGRVRRLNSFGRRSATNGSCQTSKPWPRCSRNTIFQLS